MIAGRNLAPTAGPATATSMEPAAAAVAADGDLYIVDDSSNVVEKVTPSGALSIVAGVVGRSGVPTPGPATSSDLNDPSAVAVDAAGDLYIADKGNDVVEEVTPSGALSIVAGVVGHPGTPTPGPATSSDVGTMTAVAADATGDVYIADAGNDVVEEVTPSGTLSIVAGVVGEIDSPTPGPATSSDLGFVDGLAVDTNGDIYITDTLDDVVEKVTSSGTLSIVAGVLSDDGGTPTPGPATSSDLGNPAGVAVDASGDLYIADTTSDGTAGNDVVEEVTPSGTLSIVAGVVGRHGAPTPGVATSSDLGYAFGVAADTSGDVYIADTDNGVMEKVTPSGTLSIVAGVAGGVGAPTPGPATSSGLGGPSGTAVDASGDVYIADPGNDVVEKVTPSGTLSIIAGVAGQRGVPTPGPATSSDLEYPSGVAVDASGDVYIADSGNDVVEEVTPSGALSIVAGVAGVAGPPTPGPATSSDLSRPWAVAVDAHGDLYIADTGNNVVEEVTPSGKLSIVAGVAGTAGFPTPGPATSSHLYYAEGVAVDASGDLYIADAGNDVVEKVTPSGTLSIVAGVADSSAAPTPGPAANSHLNFPSGVAVDASDDLFIADENNDLVEKVTPSGTLSIVAGITGQSGFPSSGPATDSDLSRPMGVAVDASGDLYVADFLASDVDEVFTPATKTGVACTPAAVTAGATVTCTATVTGVGLTPTGTVTFASSPSGGVFGSSGSCSLAAGSVSGSASCEVSFTASAAGSYVVTGSYGGDSDHVVSASPGTTVAVNSPPATGPGTAQVPSVHAQGETTSVKVGCSGVATQLCAVKLVLTGTEQIRQGRHVRTVTVTIGTAAVTLSGGASRMVTVTLNGAGRALLARDHTLVAQLTASEGGKKIRKQSVRLTVPTRKQKR